ncbi:MAG: dihydropteridine reductase [Clostridiales bacterium]|nr:dihydropteridine reductase [Clostridiales bacterium]
MNTDKIYAESIAKEYAPKSTSKIVALKKLDKKAKRKANIFAYSFGIITALILGTGMCLSMNVIGSGTFLTVFGVIIGIIGIIGVSVNFPIYKKMIESGKKKYAFEIMQLAKEISDEAE